MTSAFARRLIVVSSLASVLLLAGIFGLRVGTPYALEWQEGGFLEHVRRVLEGRPLFAVPTPDHIAFPYPPLYVWVASLFASVFGASLLSLRLVSLLATALLFVSLGRLAVRVSGSPLGGWLAVGVLAAGYRFTGAWLDIARVDALSLGLLMFGVERLASAESGRRVLLAGLAIAAATLAKQNALVVGFAVCLALARSPKRSAALGTVVLVPVLAVAGWLQIASEGRFGWTVITQLAGHPWHEPAILGTWIELGLALPVALVVGLLGVLKRGPLKHRSLVLVVSLALFLMAWSGRAHTGGYDNTLLPALVAAALLFGSGAPRLVAGRSTATLVALGAVAQLAFLWVDPRPVLPGAERGEQARRIIDVLEGYPSPVLAPYCPELALAAGHASGGAHGMAVIDLLRSGDEERAGAFVKGLESSLQTGRWSAVLVPGSWFEDLPALGVRYRLVGELPLEPVTGAVHSPLLLLERRD